MDVAAINATITGLIQQPQTALLAGLLAAFTPCTLALIPIFLYRFGVWGPSKSNKHKTAAQWRHTFVELGFLWLGYLVSFAVFGWFLSNLFGSDFVNIARLVLGSALVLIGVLQLGGQITLDFIRANSNSFIIGLSLPLIISFSPCVLPVISPLVAVSSNDNSAVFRFLLFGVGILIPAFALALGGRKLMEVFRQSNKLTSKIEKLSAILIIGSGIYLSTQLVKVSYSDVIIDSAVLLILIITIVYLVIVNQKLTTVHNFGWGLGLLLAWVAAFAFVTNRALSTQALRGNDLIYACSTIGTVLNSDELMVALVLCFLSFGIGWYYISRHRQGRKLKFRFSQA